MHFARKPFLSLTGRIRGLPGAGRKRHAGRMAFYAWPCAGCGGPVEIRPPGRTAYACSDSCRAAAWRDERAGRSEAELAVLRAQRRAAREAEGRRVTPGEIRA